MDPGFAPDSTGCRPAWGLTVQGEPLISGHIGVVTGSSTEGGSASCPVPWHWLAGRAPRLPLGGRARGWLGEVLGSLGVGLAGLPGDLPPFPFTAANPLLCSTARYHCRNGLCIDKSFICDGQNNCQDNSDEESCESSQGRSRGALSSDPSAAWQSLRQTWPGRKVPTPTSKHSLGSSYRPSSPGEGRCMGARVLAVPRPPFCVGCSSCIKCHSHLSSSELQLAPLRDIPLSHSAVGF